MTVCGVLLYEAVYTELGKVLEPYVQTGPIGKYIYCSMAVQNGNFIDMTFDPAQTGGSVANRMLISVPVQFVKFMATGADLKSIGFTSGQGDA